MGGVPIDTDSLAGAQRELKEETGLTAARWQQILSVRISNSVTDESGVVYVARKTCRTVNRNSTTPRRSRSGESRSTPHLKWR